MISVHKVASFVSGGVSVP